MTVGAVMEEAGKLLSEVVLRVFRILILKTVA
jgi:hypothetical protein